VVQTVLWSVQPALVGRAARQQRQLVQRIDEGLASIDTCRPTRSAGRTCCAALRDLALSAAGSPRRPEPRSAARSRAPGWRRWRCTNRASCPTARAGWRPRPSRTAAAQELAVGAYVDLLARGWERWQLTWASPHGLLFMFSHASGATRSMTRAS
jgi:hypothetical protein